MPQNTHIQRSATAANAAQVRGITTMANIGPAPAGYSLPYLLSYLLGPGANVVATLQAHCHAAWGNRLKANKYSPARGLMRGVNLGAVSLGAGRYPACTGKVWAAGLQAAANGAKPDATAQAMRSAATQANKVWQAGAAGSSAAGLAAQRTQATLKAQAASRKATREAKAQAKAPQAPAPAPAPAPAQAPAPAPAPAPQA